MTWHNDHMTELAQVFSSRETSFQLEHRLYHF